MPRIIDVVEFTDESGREMVHRIPENGSGDFRLGSQVIVREQQAAVFFRDGKAMDVFGPGRHTITTANMPILSGLVGLATSGRTPFTAEVYYVSTRTYLDMGWGTPEPVTFRDPDLGMVRLRANGVYSMEVGDPALFVDKVVGVRGIYETPEIVRVASPCYLKMEPGPGLVMYMPWGSSEQSLADLGREKIRSIKNIIELVSETYPKLKLSKQGPKDLRIPLTK